MDEFEKIEKLVEKANVTYEEARDALRACSGDLLDAMIYLEKLGKTSGPKKSSYSTNYEEQEQYEDVEEKVENNQHTKGHTSTIGSMFRKFWDFIWSNSFLVNRSGKEIVRIPVWLLVLLLLINWKFSLAVLVVALFFGCRYAFFGQDDMHGANDFMDKAGDMADHVKESMKNTFSDENKKG